MNDINLSSFLDWIRQINGGNIVPEIPDEKSEIPLPSKNVALYSQPLAKSAKFFFFADLGDTQNIEEAIADIETITIHKRSEWIAGEGPHPSDSYIIYFWEIPDFTENVSKEIIKLEENEFTYKKYVFYYTLSEYEAFCKWLGNKTDNKLNQNILRTIKGENIESAAMSFLLRLLIKIPCIPLSFQANELPDYDELVVQNILGIQDNEQKNRAKDLNQLLLQCWDENLSPEEIANRIIDDFEE